MRVQQTEPTRLIVAIADEAETVALGQALAILLEPGAVVALVGTLGAGKTRLSRAIAEALGVDPGVIASPTFVLINEIDGANFPVYHVDTYRLDSPAVFDSLGASEYWTDEVGVCLIEWADLVIDRLPDSAWWVWIEAGSDPAGRSVTIFHPEPDEIADLCSLLNAPA